MKPKNILKISHFPQIFGILASFFVAFGSARPVFAADLSGLLCKANGSVEVLAGGGGSTWKPAKIGMGLTSQDRIRTGAGSSAQILLQDGSFYVIKEKCVLEILELTYDRETKSIGSSFKIHKGRFLGRVSKLLPKSSASFQSPTALVAVRGTELSLDVAESGDTDIFLNEGRIVVTDFVQGSALPTDQRELLLELLHEVSLKNGQAARVTATGISRSKKTAAQIKESGDEFSAVRSEAGVAAQKESALSYEDSQARRKKIRSEVLP